MRTINHFWKTSLLLVLAGCGGCGGSGNSGSPDMALAVDPCSRGVLESDLKPSPWQGPGVDANGNVTPGQYVVSTTYAQLKPDAMPEFMQVLGPIQTALKTQPGLVAARMGLSATCGSGRTLAVWADEASMYNFVFGPAHSAAVGKIGDISRGGGAVTHFADDGSGATFENAATRLGVLPSEF